MAAGGDEGEGKTGGGGGAGGGWGTEGRGEEAQSRGRPPKTLEGAAGAAGTPLAPSGVASPPITAVQGRVSPSGRTPPVT